MSRNGHVVTFSPVDESPATRLDQRATKLTSSAHAWLDGNIARRTVNDREFFWWDTELPGFGIPFELIVAVAVVSALLLGMVGSMALKVRQRPVVSGDEELIGSIGEMLKDAETEGWARVHGESWQVQTRFPLLRGQKVRVLARNGLVLQVTPTEVETSAHVVTRSPKS